MKKLFILYDGRAKTGDDKDIDRSSVMCTADSEKEAREDGKDWHNYDAIWYEYDVAKDGINLINGVPRWDIPPSKDL